MKWRMKGFSVRLSFCLGSPCARSLNLLKFYIIRPIRFRRWHGFTAKKKLRYQFESGTSHLRCLRLAFRERLPRRHVCGKHISSSFSPPIFISLTLTLSRSFACAPRVWELACVPVQVATCGRRCWYYDSRPCVGEAWTWIRCGSVASFALSGESHTTRASCVPYHVYIW